MMEKGGRWLCCLVSIRHLAMFENTAFGGLEPHGSKSAGGRLGQLYRLILNQQAQGCSVLPDCETVELPGRSVIVV